MVLSSPSVGFGRDLGTVPRRHWLPLLCCTEVIPSGGRQFVYPRPVGGTGRLLARSNARLSNASGKDHESESRSAEYFHYEREWAVHGIESGISDCVSEG